MAFSETDYTKLIDAIDAIRDKVKDPLVFDAILDELLGLHDDVSVYPGLTAFYAGQLLRQGGPGELRPGTKVAFARGGRTFTGVIAAVDGGKVTVEQVRAVHDHEPLQLDASELKIIDRGVFYHPGDAHWSTLRHPMRREVNGD